MNIQTFNEKAKAHVVQELAYLNNQIVGSDKTAFTALGLFLKMPIMIHTHKYENNASDKKLDIADLMQVFSCYTDIEKQEVNFVFFYRDEKQLKHIMKIIKKQTIFFAYHYMKEIQHVLRKHYTGTFQSMLLKKYKQRGNPHFMIKLACDYKVNYIMDRLFSLSKLSSNWQDIKKHIALDERFNEMVEPQIIKELKEDSIKCTPILNNDRFVESEINGFKYITPNALITGDISQDIVTQNLASAIISVIRTNAKGTIGCNIMVESFESIKTDAAWFDKLKGTIVNTIYNKTNKHDRGWKNLKRTYRHIFKSPDDLYAENKVKIILAVDESGSMEINDFQKLLGIFESQSHKISELILLKYDVDLTLSTHMESLNDISEHPNFKHLGKRYSNGGTSINATLAYIQDMKIKNPKDWIFINMSDNYDDKYQVWKNYPIMRKLTCFFLAPQNCPEVDTKICPGTNIKLP